MQSCGAQSQQIQSMVQLHTKGPGTKVEEGQKDYKIQRIRVCSEIVPIRNVRK